MDVVELLPELHMLRFDLGYAYLWSDPDALTLIDTGVVGSAPAVEAAIRGLGRTPADLRRVVLTHFHEDHTGSAAEIGSWPGVTVVAHHEEAPVIRGTRSGTRPDFGDAPDWERELFENKPDLPPAPPARVDREVGDGDVLDFGGGARVVGVPGHTDGSIALFLPGPGVLFTGDAVANVGGRTILGVFNADRAQAIASLRRLSGLDARVACFGHGEPLLAGADAALRGAVETV